VRCASLLQQLLLLF